MLKQLDYRITTICNSKRTKERQSQFVAQLHRLLVSYGSFNFFFVCLFVLLQSSKKKVKLLAAYTYVQKPTKKYLMSKTRISRVVVRHMISLI